MEKCKKHPWYTGKKKSRTGCSDCAKIYDEAHQVAAPAPVAETATPETQA